MDALYETMCNVIGKINKEESEESRDVNRKGSRPRKKGKGVIATRLIVTVANTLISR